MKPETVDSLDRAKTGLISPQGLGGQPVISDALFDFDLDQLEEDTGISIYKPILPPGSQGKHGDNLKNWLHTNVEHNPLMPEYVRTTIDHMKEDSKILRQ